MDAEEMLRMTDPVRTEIRHDGGAAYLHTTNCMWLNLFCHRCDHRLRGVEPATRGPAIWDEVRRQLLATLGPPVSTRDCVRQATQLRLPIMVVRTAVDVAVE